MKTCSSNGCARRAVSRGLCDAHRKQLARTGSLVPLRTGDLTHELGSVKVPSWMLEVIRQAAKLDGVTVAEWIREALLAALPLERMAE